MKKMIIASLVLASTTFAQAADVTVLSANLPAVQGHTSVDTKFYIDTDMKEGFAKINVDEAVTVYVRDCSGGGYNGPGYPGPGYPGPGYPGRYCRTIPQTSYRPIMSQKVKIEGMTMNGDDVIYQSADGDVNCGKMGVSRVFHIPTFYLSGKCQLVGKIVGNMVTVTFKTK